MIYGLYMVQDRGSYFGGPILYSTDIDKLRKVMLKITAQRVCNVGTPDITNSPDVNSFTERDKYPYCQIESMPTII